MLVLLVIVPIGGYFFSYPIALLKAKEKVWYFDPTSGKAIANEQHKDIYLYCSYGVDGYSLYIKPVADSNGYFTVPLNTGLAWNITMLKGSVLKQKLRKIFFHEKGYVLYASVSERSHELKIKLPRKELHHGVGKKTIHQIPQPFGTIVSHYWVTGNIAEENLLVVVAGYQPFDEHRIRMAFEAQFKKDVPINLNAAEDFFRNRYQSIEVYYFTTSGKVRACDYYLKRAGKK